MGIKEICRFFSHRLFEAFVVVVLILFLPNLPPYTSFSEQLRVPPTRPLLEGKLNDVEIWHKGDFVGPEAFADYNGELYVTLYGGDVVKLNDNHITPIVKTGKPCKGSHEERICGRPLGMEFDKKGALYVADAYYGIFKVDVQTGEKKLIISVDQEINGKKPKIPNSIALASNGDLYWSDSSSEFQLENGIFDLLADPSGRLIHYDAKTKKNKVLIDKIHFANGVALSDDEEFVIVAETAGSRLHRYYLKGSKKGTHDIFIDGLPGIPDNLKSDGKGGFFVPLLIAIDEDHPSPSQAIGPFPLLRKFVARVFGLTELLFETLNKVYPSEFAQRAVHFIGHFTSVGTIFTPKRVTVIHLDKSGNVIDSLHGTNKKIGNICEVHIFKDTLYLGSPFNDYIARVPLSKIGWDHLKPERRKREVPAETVTQAPTPTQRSTTTRPPTTTTPPPPSTTTTRPTTTTARPTTTTARPTTTTPRPTTTTPRPSTTTPRPTTTTPRPTTTTPRPTTTTTTPPPTTTTTVPKQAPPQPKQSSPPSQQTPPQQQAPPPKQQTPPSQKPPTQSPPSKQSPPPVAQPIRDQTKTVPAKEPTKTTK